jgi:hypothetical protein
MIAASAPVTRDFSKATVHWNASPFPNLVVLLHSPLETPKEIKRLVMSVREAEELARLLTRAAEHARAYWKENGIEPYE